MPSGIGRSFGVPAGAQRKRVPVGGSIGPHTHTDNCEVMCIVSGTGLCHDDGTEVTLTPGMWHYCPQGHSHSVRNTGTEPLVIRAVLPKGR